MMQLLNVFLSLAIASASAWPLLSQGAPQRRDLLAEGKQAQALNLKFESLTPDTPCNVGDAPVCINHQFAECVDGTFSLSPCGDGAQCFALPGPVVTCATQNDTAARIAATGATGGIDGSDDTGSGGNGTASSTASSTDATASSTDSSTDGSASSTDSSGDATATSTDSPTAPTGTITETAPSSDATASSTDSSSDASSTASNGN